MAMARLHKPFQGTPAMLKMAAEVESACTQRTIDWSDPGAPVNADSIPLVLAKCTVMGGQHTHENVHSGRS